MRSLRVLLAAAALCFYAATATASLDNDLVGALEESLDSDLLIITMKQLKPRKVPRQDIETLLALQGSGDAIFGVKLDRHTKRMLFESRTEKKHLKVGTAEGGKTISSLVLQIDQSKDLLDVTVYIDCVKEGKVSLSENLREMFPKTQPLTKVYRERKYITELDSDTEVAEVLKRLRCEGTMLATQPQPADEIPEEERVAQVQINRGDIPILHDCDDNLLIKTINDLIKVVKRLQDELEKQRIETQNLRELLEQCDICRPGEGY